VEPDTDNKAGAERLKNRERAKALRDRSAWLLIAIGIVVLGLTDFALLATLLQWTAFSLVLAGVTIVVSRVTFPTLSLSDLLEKAKAGELPSAVVVAALVLFVGLLFNGIVTWAK